MSFHALKNRLHRNLRQKCCQKFCGHLWLALGLVGWCASGHGASASQPIALDASSDTAVNTRLNAARIDAASTPALDVPIPSIMPPGFAQQSPAAQSDWLTKEAASGLLDKASDAQLLGMMQVLSPEALVDYLRDGIQPLTTYQFEMTRWERHDGQWPSRPDRMLVRYQDSPRRVYVRWLAGGKHAGQEVLYDETQNAGEVLGHFGGLLRFASISFPITGVVAHSQSAHSVRDLGLQFAVKMLEHDLTSYHEEGLDGRPTRLAIVHEAMAVQSVMASAPSEASASASASASATSAAPAAPASAASTSIRLISMIWDVPGEYAESTAHYAPRVELAIDLNHPWPREVASWDRTGRPLENVRFAHVEARQWDANTFDRHNPDYHF